MRISHAGYCFKNCLREIKHPNHPTSMLHNIIVMDSLNEKNLICNKLEDRPCSTLVDIYIKVANNAASPIIPPSAPWIMPSM